jgi:hypothetical protein
MLLLSAIGSLICTTRVLGVMACLQQLQFQAMVSKGRNAILLVLFVTIPQLLLANYCPATGKPGVWSKKATYLCSRATKTGFTRDMKIYSPNHRMRVHVVNDHWYVEIGERVLRLTESESYVSYYPAELSWSPDSSMFYITQSDATSEINGFHTDVYRVGDRDISILPNLVSPVRDHFGQRQGCKDEGANVAGLGWFDKKILVVAEVPPDSDCGPRGYFTGYQISPIEAQILSEYNPQSLIQRWGSLFGLRLKENYAELRPPQRRGEP